MIKFLSLPGWFLLGVALAETALFRFMGWTPIRQVGAWLNVRARRKTLRLLHAVAFWAAEPDGCE